MAFTYTKTIATLGFDAHQCTRAAIAATSTGINCVHYDSASELKLSFSQMHILLMPLDRCTERMLEIQRELRAGLHPLCVVYISDRAKLEAVVRAVQLGAISVLPSDYNDDELIAAIYVSLKVYDQRANWLSEYKNAVNNFNCLTPRQKAILHLVIAGFTNKATAIKLQISEKTVEKHRHTIQQRMRAASLPELTAKFLLTQESTEAAYGWRMNAEGDAVSDEADTAPDCTIDDTALNLLDDDSLMSFLFETSHGGF